MRARVTVPHQGRKRGSVVEIDPAEERGRLANEWLVPIDPPTPEPPPKPPKRTRKRKPPAAASDGQSAA